MGCCCITARTIGGYDSFPVIHNTEVNSGRLEPKPQEMDGFLDNMISEVSADRKSVEIRRVLLLYNPFSGNGLGNVNSERLAELLEAKGIVVTKMVSERPGHFRVMSQEMEFTEYDCVAICGGDGTIHEFLQGVIHRDLNIPIALCPGGTGNGLTWSLGIKTPEDSLACIASNSHIGVDCNRLVDATGKTFYSHSVIGAGLIHDANERSESCRCCGPKRYDCAALSLFCQNYSIPIEMDLDGKMLSCDSICFVLMNNTTTAHGSHMTPFASITDGYFDIGFVPKVKFITALDALTAVKDGGHIHKPELSKSFYRAKKMKYHRTGGICIDGENCAEGPCEVDCMPSSWRLMNKRKVAMMT